MLNSEQMLPGRIRNMRQMKELLDAEDVVLAEIERMIEDMYRRESMLHEELVNEEWLESRLYGLTGAETDVTGYADDLLVFVQLIVSELGVLELEAVRLFLNKWLPAHLMYKLGYLFVYPVRNQEQILISRLGIHMSFPFWQMRVLNGEWLLDGSVNLGQKARWQMNVGIIHGQIWLLAEERAGFSGMKIFMCVPDIQERCESALEIKAAVLSADAWSGNMENISIGIPVLESETVKSESVTVRKDLWYLDGMMLLDGSRILDAEIREESL